MTAAKSADLAVVVGSSLEVRPAATRCAVAAPPAIINADPTPYDAMATQVIRGDIPAILSRIHVS